MPAVIPEDLSFVLPKNTRAVLIELLIHGPRSRAELAAKLGLSKATLTRITRDLMSSGLLTEGATELRAALGRPSELLRVVPEARFFIGIKLTSTALHACVTDLAANVVDSLTVALTSTRFDDVVGRIAEVAAHFTARHPRIVAVGITVGGRVKRGAHAVVIDSEFLDWQERPLPAAAALATGLPTVAENDVQALAAAEHWFGAAAGLDSVALVTVGAGIGCGLIINGELVSGAHGVPGRIDHLLVDLSGPVCELGHRGCVSAYLTNAAIVNALGGDGDYAAALMRARAADPAAMRVFDDAGFALGSIIGTLVSLVDPEKVILTGDGLPLWEVSSARVRRGIEVTAGSALRYLDLDVQAFDFSEWARAAAAVAIRMQI